MVSVGLFLEYFFLFPTKGLKPVQYQVVRKRFLGFIMLKALKFLEEVDGLLGGLQ